MNVTDHSRLKTSEMGEAIAKQMGLSKPIRYLNQAEAKEKYGAVMEGFWMDQQVSSERARRLLGWYPKHTSFVDEIESLYLAWRASQS